MDRKQTVFSTIKNWLASPSGVVIIVGTIATMTELTYLFFLEKLFEQYLKLSDLAHHLVEAVILTAGTSLALYFFVFKKMRDDVNTLREHERMKVSLKETQVRLKTTLDMLIEGAMIIGFDWKYIYVNDAAAEHGQNTKENLIGRTILEMYPGVENSEVFQHYKVCMEERVFDSFESSFSFADGATRWYSFSVEPIPEGIFVLSIETTEKKKADIEIEQLKDLYFTISRCNQAIVHTKNKDELYEDICKILTNSKMFQMAWIGAINNTTGEISPVASSGDTTGYLDGIRVTTSAQDPFGRGPTGTAAREDRPVWAEDWQNNPMTAPWHEKASVAKWLTSASLPIHLDNAVIGAITLYSKNVRSFNEEVKELLVEVASDISFALEGFKDRKQRNELTNTLVKTSEELLITNANLRKEELATEEAREKTDAVLKQLGEGLVIVDKNGIVTDINPTAERLTGYIEEELRGKKFTEMVLAFDDNGNLIPPETRPILVAIATRGSASSQSFNFMKKNRRLIPVSVIATPVMVKGELAGAVVAFRDITKEKEIEQTRKDLLALASHQLRTPLSGTKWLIETLQRGLQGPLTIGQKEYLDEIYKINERMTSLVSDMLDVLRTENTSITAKKETVRAEEFLAPIIETFSAVAKNKHLVLITKKDADHIIETDPLLLRNILESFISNAITYSNTGGEVIVSIKKIGNEYEFAVKDSGIGIPEDEQSQLFERFYRASNAKTFNTRGTGLGLYIAGILAKKIGARLSFESEEHKGSTFYAYIPATDQHGV